MSGNKIACEGHYHTCPKVEVGPRPHIGGPIVKTSQNFVSVEGRYVATVGDKSQCSGAQSVASIKKGSSFVKIEGKSVARVSDKCEHGGVITQGFSWVTLE